MSFNSFPQPKPDSGGGFIKSTQRGNTTLSAATTDIPISSIDITKSIVTIEVLPANSTTATVASALVRAKITASGNLRLTINSYDATQQPRVSWTVIEYENVKSLQSGQITSITGVNGASLSPVNPNKALVFVNYSSNNPAATIHASYLKSFLRADGFALQFEANVPSFTAEWQVIEFR